MVKKNNKTVLQVEDVTKTYQMGEVKVNAVKNVSLEIYEGEHLTIVGPSGSGKSTLLHILGLLDTPTQGKVYIEGVEVSKLQPDQLAKIRAEKIGFVFQSFYLIPSLSAIDNVMLPLMFDGVDYNIRVEKARKVLSELGMGDRVGHKPNQLSGGERQRVAIARAIVNDPTFILADEPTGNLDTKSGKAVMDIFRKLNKEGRTLVVITHDTNIGNDSDRILKIVDGEIVNESKGVKKKIKENKDKVKKKKVMMKKSNDKKK